MFNYKTSRIYFFLKQPLSFGCLILVILTFLDFFTHSISITKYLGIDEQKKENFYLFLHLFIVIVIFAFQEFNQSLQFKKQTEILDKVDANVKSMSPLKELSQQIHDEVKNWLSEDQKNIVIFYFPYSILPGFWLDTGTTFSKFIGEIETEDARSFKHILYFIGPDTTDSPFNKVMDLLDHAIGKDNFVSTNIKGKFFGGFDFSSFTIEKKGEFMNKIKNKYIERLQQIETNSREKKTIFKLLKIGTNCQIKNTENLPSFSFILKVSKNKAEEMILIDTFHTLEDSNLLKNVIHELGINAITPEILLAPPYARIVNNTHVANLFLNTFLESCCQSSGFDCLRNDLENLN